MEGDIKDIVLARLEKRLKDKDEEIRALKERLKDYDSSDGVKGLAERVDRLEAEVRETQVTLTEVMKKVGSLEAALVAMSCEEDGGEEAADPDLMLDGQSEPQAPERFDAGVAADAARETDGDKKDAMRFFHMNKNS